jgi:hydroxyethylthiazole kinase
MDPDLAESAAVCRTLAAIRARVPLVHNITNVVVANVTANALLAIGASPAMVQAEEEVGEFSRIADALVINLGTVTAERASAMRVAVAAAGEAGTPWVLDPVAVGAIGFRTRLAEDLIRQRPAAIRGNASEILSLAGFGGAGRGVDSNAGSESARQAARQLARETGAAVAVTGPVDYVTDGTRLVAIGNGHPMMTKVTGTGCTATAIVGACLAVEEDRVAASAHALVLIGVAGELAAARARGPGSFQVALLDALYDLDERTLLDRARIGVEPADPH